MTTTAMPHSTSSRRIVVIGGGTGAPVVIKSLLLGGYSDISVISASMDSGGKTGTIRSDERDRVIAISDSLRCLLALIKDSDNHKSQVEAFTELASFTDGRKRNLGYSLYYALLEKYSNDFLLVQRHIEQLLNITFSGTVIPVTTTPTNICFSTLNGNTYCGEHELDHQSMSANTVTNMWLDPRVSATPEACKALTSATHICYAPGSMYGSILANFLPGGIKQALKQTSAKKIFITNLVSTRNQDHDFSLSDYQKLFTKYSGLRRPFDIVITSDISRTQFESRYKEESSRYALEHAYVIGWDSTELQYYENEYSVISAPIATITPDLHRIRHNKAKLASVLKSIIL